MARKSLIARDEKRRKLYEKYKAKREELKDDGDYEGLQKLPKNSSPVRLKIAACLQEDHEDFIVNLVYPGWFCVKWH